MCSNQDLTLKNLLLEFLMESSGSSRAKIFDQYADGLLEVLCELEAAGYGTHAVREKIKAALRNNNQVAYVGLACELSVSHYFKVKFPEKFVFQVENISTASADGTPNSFDYSFTVGDIKFNVEVKTFSRDIENRGESPIKAFLPREQLKGMIAKGARVDSNCVPALGRFLRDANNQLCTPENGLGVVVICCSDLDEYADALESFCGTHGIINSFLIADENKRIAPLNIIPDIKDIPNIGSIVLCNMGFSHWSVLSSRRLHDFYNNTEIELGDGRDAWRYELTLPIGFFLKKEAPPLEIIRAFTESFCSWRYPLHEIMKKNGGDIQAALFELFELTSKSSMHAHLYSSHD